MGGGSVAGEVGGAEEEGVVAGEEWDGGAPVGAGGGEVFEMGAVPGLAGVAAPFDGEDAGGVCGEAADGDLGVAGDGAHGVADVEGGGSGFGGGGLDDDAVEIPLGAAFESAVGADKEPDFALGVGAGGDGRGPVYCGQAQVAGRGAVGLTDGAEDGSGGTGLGLAADVNVEAQPAIGIGGGERLLGGCPSFEINAGTRGASDANIGEVCL